MRDLVTRTFVVIAALIGTVALVVWFGVNLGLRPLLNLEEAISRRSSDDLSPIRRAVPKEARGIVGTLNQLLGQVSQAMAAQSSFISNAAHQLRNPIAGVLAMAEAVRSAPTGEAARERADDLVTAARKASDLANKLLTLERATSSTRSAPFDLADVVRRAAAGAAPAVESRGLSLTLDVPGAPVTVVADALMVQEAVSNLIDNALCHGGPNLTKIDVVLRVNGDAALCILDDGRGVAPAQHETIRARFGQAAPGPGSGLGLSIADVVAERHGGRLTILTLERGFGVELRLPLAAAADRRNQTPGIGPVPRNL
jgi:two-component system sensor histidine kinase TctE